MTRLNRTAHDSSLPKLEPNSDHYIFEAGIKPMWEDPENANGKKWVLVVKNNLTVDRCCTCLAMVLVGEELDEGDDICGAVVGMKSRVDRIHVWPRSKDDVEGLNGIGRKVIKLLDVFEADRFGLKFQVCTLVVRGVIS